MSNFRIQENLAPASAERVAEVLGNPGFGNHFTDYMAHIRYEANPEIDSYLGVSSANGVWSEHEIIPFQNLSISPAASVFHYGQEIFEGIKAFKREDGSVWTFRYNENAKRFNQSAQRLGLPDLPEADFMDSIRELVAKDSRWAASGQGQALYIRPFMIASEPFLGVRSAHLVDYYCILSPSANYFNTSRPVDIWVEREYFRAGPGGTGAAKCGGNYAASLYPGQLAYAKGFSQVLYLDARDQDSVEELGGMSFFVAYKDGRVRTPALNGQILPSITRDSIITILKDEGIDVQETKISITELAADLKAGRVAEVFACGTAAAVSAIGRLVSTDFDVDFAGGVEGELVQFLRSTIVGIQMGSIEDTRGWTFRLL